jgi:CRISPR/Cas system CSM-associated protein Csm2 small subunit
MQPIDADPEDIREIMHAAKVIHQAIVDNNLQIAYVMEVLQGLYANQARQLVSYEEYCEKVDLHKKSFRNLWEKKS